MKTLPVKTLVASQMKSQDKSRENPQVKLHSKKSAKANLACAAAKGRAVDKNSQLAVSRSSLKIAVGSKSNLASPAQVPGSAAVAAAANDLAKPVGKKAGANSRSCSNAVETETQLEMPFVNDPSFAVMPPSQLDLLMRATAALKSAVGAVSDAITDAVVREQTSMNLSDVREICARITPQASQMPEISPIPQTLAQSETLLEKPQTHLATPLTPEGQMPPPVVANTLASTDHQTRGPLIHKPTAQLPPLYLDPETLNIRTVSEEAEMAAEWIELYPQGISVTSTVGRPVLVLKDQRGVEVLPVWMNPLDAGIAIAELTTSSGATPHMVTRRMMEALKIRATRCSFVELVGHHQYVVVEFEGNEDLKAIRVRADEAMSFCVQARVKFQATRAFMRLCRDVDADMEKLETGNSANHSTGSNSFSENSSKKHPYVI